MFSAKIWIFSNIFLPPHFWKILRKSFSKKKFASCGKIRQKGDKLNSREKRTKQILKFLDCMIAVMSLFLSFKMFMILIKMEYETKSVFLKVHKQFCKIFSGDYFFNFMSCRNLNTGLLCHCTLRTFDWAITFKEQYVSVTLIDDFFYEWNLPSLRFYVYQSAYEFK